MAAVALVMAAKAANPVRADFAALATPEKSIIALVAPLEHFAASSPGDIRRLGVPFRLWPEIRGILRRIRARL
jgi:hypothetical protein